MSDDLDKKIKQIADVLGQGDMPDNLKGLLSVLADSMSGEKPSQKGEADKQKDRGESKNELAENMDMIRKVTTIMNKMSSVNDPRINLLQAIKPFLNSRRQGKLNNCVNILRMSSMVKLLDEGEKGS